MDEKAMANPRSARRSRPFVKVPHLEDLELSNRDLAIYVRLLWLVDDEEWRRGGTPGIAPISEATLRQVVGTTRLGVEYSLRFNEIAQLETFVEACIDGFENFTTF